MPRNHGGGEGVQQGVEAQGGVIRCPDERRLDVDRQRRQEARQGPGRGADPTDRDSQEERPIGVLGRGAQRDPEASEAQERGEADGDHHDNQKCSDLVPGEQRLPAAVVPHQVLPRRRDRRPLVGGLLAEPYGDEEAEDSQALGDGDGHHRGDEPGHGVEPTHDEVGEQAQDRSPHQHDRKDLQVVGAVLQHEHQCDHRGNGAHRTGCEIDDPRRPVDEDDPDADDAVQRAQCQPGDEVGGREPEDQLDDGDEDGDRCQPAAGPRRPAWPSGRLDHGGERPGQQRRAHEDRFFGIGGSESLGKLCGKNLEPSMLRKVPGLLL